MFCDIEERGSEVETPNYSTFHKDPNFVQSSSIAQNILKQFGRLRLRFGWIFFSTYLNAVLFLYILNMFNPI